MFLEVTNKCTQNLKLVESVTEMCDKLNATSVKMTQYTQDMSKKTDTKDTQKIRRDMTLLAGIDFVTNKV